MSLPADLVASYRLLDAADFPHDIGGTREGWMRVHQEGHPDPLCVETLPNPLGSLSSILRGPRAHQHPAETRRGGREGESRASLHLPARAVGTFGAAWLTLPARTDRLLVAFDGETWRKLELARLLATASPTTALLLIDSGDFEQRGAYLPHPRHAARAVEDAVADARAAGLPEHVDPAETIVSGQSYGGLAAGAVVTGYPSIARSAIVQSGSFWFRADAVVRETLDGTPGDVLSGLAGRDLTGQRLVVQYGSNEKDLAGYGRTFVRATRERGASAVERQYAGGHDYAWWRTGLLEGLDALAALDA